MRARFARSVALVGALALVAAACGGDDDDDEVTTEAGADTEATDAAADTTEAEAADTTEAEAVDTTAAGADTTAAGADTTAAAGADTTAAGGGEGAAAACEADEFGCVVVEAGDPITIGTLLVITTENSTLGLDSQYGIELAADYLDGTFDATFGQVLGHDVEFNHQDDLCG